VKVSRHEAKDHAREHMRGIWAAALNPFKPETFALDEAGLRANLRHWVDDLHIAGVFMSGKQGEFFSMSLDERKRSFEIAVEECAGQAGTIMSCSDQNFGTVLELARHAQDIGADYIVVHAPMLHFVTDPDQTVYEYYRAVSEAVDIGIAMWSHPDSGYLMSPELCARVAELPNIVAIKYSVPREMYVRLTEIAGDRLLVSTASEAEWLDNILELGWQLYLCSSPPYQLQTRTDQRMNDYTRLAFEGREAEARAVCASLQPVRDAIQASKPGGKPHAHGKYRPEPLGQVGAPLRAHLLPLAEPAEAAPRAAFDGCGLQRDASPGAAG